MPVTDRQATFEPAGLRVVLLCPEIPPNTGNVGRLCLAAGATLHLVGPLGFTLDDRAVKRAGLDYWPDVDLRLWENWEAFAGTCLSREGARFFLLTTKTDAPYWAATYVPGDYLIFGSETRGLPESLLAAHPDRLRTIPQQPTVRSLNLATAVGIVLYEAVRQLAAGR